MSPELHSIVSPELQRPPVRRQIIDGLGVIARVTAILPGLDEAEGRMVAEWLAKRLPVGRWANSDIADFHCNHWQTKPTSSLTPVL